MKTKKRCSEPFEGGLCRDFCEKFQEKAQTPLFEKEFLNFISYDSWQKESLTRKKGIDSACDEISALLDLAKYYKAPHLQWTGNHTLDSQFDGILYFNRANGQKIEISRIIDEKQEKDMKEKGEFSRVFRYGNLDQGCGGPIGSNDETEDISQFIYKRIVKILSKKNQNKYTGCWLAITYDPVSNKMQEDYINKPIFKKLENEEKDLLFSARGIFKKIIFVPGRAAFTIIQSSALDVSYKKVFEWKYAV